MPTGSSKGTNSTPGGQVTHCHQRRPQEQGGSQQVLVFPPYQEAGRVGHQQAHEAHQPGKAHRRAAQHRRQGKQEVPGRPADSPRDWATSSPRVSRSSS